MIKSCIVLVLLVLMMSYRVRCQFPGRSSNGFVSAVATGQSGVAHSSSTGSDGVTRGQCAYIDNGGREIRISYREFNDRIQIDDINYDVEDPVGAVRECRLMARDQAERTEKEVQRHHEQVQNQIYQQQANILRQQQQMFQQFPNFNIPAMPFPNFF